MEEIECGNASVPGDSQRIGEKNVHMALEGAPPFFVDSPVSEPEFRVVALSAMIIGLLVQFGPSYA